MRVPFFDLKEQYRGLRAEIMEAFESVFNESRFLFGASVREFEASFRSIYGIDHCVGVGNCTDALFVSLKALGVGPGDEVVTPAFSWFSTSEVISLAGAKPVFVDVEPEYYTLDPAGVEKCLSKKTKAVIAVHLYGQVASIKILKSICQNNALRLIEDCAHALLGTQDGKHAGTYGDCGCFSFYPTKNLGAYGDAGCVITHNAALAANIRRWANHGGLTKDEHVLEGVNSRLDTLQAAVLCAKLRYLEGWTRRREQIASMYTTRLTGVHGITVPGIRPETRHTFHLYVIQAVRRDRLIEFLHSHGIECQVHYPRALPFEPAYAHLDYRPDAFPVSSRLQDTVLSLPIYPELSDEKVEYVCEKVSEFYR